MHIRMSVKLYKHWINPIEDAQDVPHTDVICVVFMLACATWLFLLASGYWLALSYHLYLYALLSQGSCETHVSLVFFYDKSGIVPIAEKG